MNFLPKKQPKSRIFSRSALSGFLAVLLLASIALAGSLTPPGAPGSTMNTLAEIYDTIAGAFDSTGVVADQNGSLIEHLKYIEDNMPSLGVSSDSLDFDEFVDSMTLDADTNIASAGFALTTSANVGIGTTTPREALEVDGFIRTSTSSWEFAADLGATRNIIGAITEYNGKVYVGTGAGAGDAAVFVYDGATWSLSSDFGGAYSYIATMGVYAGRLYAGVSTYGGSDIYVFDGTSWTLSYNGGSLDDFRAMTVYNGKLYVGAGYDLFDHHILSFDGTTWVSEFHDSGATAYGAYSAAVYNGKYYAGTCCASAQITQFDGRSFTAGTQTFAGHDAVTALAVYNGKLYAGLGTGAGDGDVYVYDGGAWALNNDFGVGMTEISDLFAYAGKLYAATRGTAAGIYVYDGTTWTLALSPTAPATDFYRVGVSVGKLFAGANGADGAADVYSFHERLETQLFKDFMPEFAKLGEGPLHITRDLTVLGNLGVASSSPFTKFALVGSAGNYDILNVASSSGTSIFRITKSGNVGVGTTTPITQLHVPGKVPTSAIGSVTTGALPQDLYIQGRYAYVANQTANTLQIFDVSNPAAPVSVGSAATGTLPSGVFVQGRYAYVTVFVSQTIQIFDVSNPAAPVLVSTTATSVTRPRNIYVQGRYAYVTVTNGGATNLLQIFDVSNPAAPVSVSTTTTGTTPWGVYVQGKYAYVTNNTANTLQIFDVSNPAVPVSVGSVATGTAPRRVFVQGRYAYVANSTSNTLQIFDVSNPAAPVSVGSVATGAGPQGVYVQGQYAYVGNTTASTLQIFNVSNPAAPISVGSITTDTLPVGVFIQGRYAYVTTNTNSKFQVFDLGGAYIQQLEAGGIEAGTLSLRNSLQVFNDADVRGGMVIGRGLQVTGPFSVTSSISGYKTFTINANGTASISGNFGPTTTNAYDLGSSALRWRNLYVQNANFGGGASFSGNIDPATDNTYDLGEPARRWRALYLGPGSLHISSTTGTSGAGSNYTDGMLAFSGASLSFGTSAVGTGSAGSLDLTTAGTSRMRITTAGNVGIGTTNPAEVLEIQDANGAPLSVYRTVNNTNAGTGIDFALNNSNSTRFIYARLAGSIGSSTAGAEAGRLGFVTRTGGGALTENMRLSGIGGLALGSTFVATDPGAGAMIMSGNLGIGTTTPAGLPLLVTADGSANGIRVWRNFNPNGGVVGLMLALNNSNGTLTDYSQIRGVSLDNTAGTEAGAIIFETKRAGTMTEAVRINNNGNVGIGTTVPSTKLAVSGTASISGNIFMTGLSAANANDEFVCRDPVTGEITFGVTCTASSIKFKENVEDLSHGLDWVRELRPVTFDWKHNGAPSLGFIAEEVNAVTPLLALYQDGEVYSVNYQIMTSVLARAIQELDGKIEDLVTEGPIAFDEEGMFDRFVAMLRNVALNVRELISDRVRTKELCVDDICVTREQFRQMVEQSGIEPSSEPEQGSPTPTPEPSPSSTPDTPQPTVSSEPEPSPEPEINGSDDEPLPSDDPEPAPEAPEATP